MTRPLTPRADTLRASDYRTQPVTELHQSDPGTCPQCRDRPIEPGRAVCFPCLFDVCEGLKIVRNERMTGRVAVGGVVPQRYPGSHAGRR